MDKIFAARNLFFAKAFLLPQMCVGQNINEVKILITYSYSGVELQSTTAKPSDHF